MFEEQHWSIMAFNATGESEKMSSQLRPNFQSVMSIKLGLRPRGVGINCLVALEREAWHNEYQAEAVDSRLLSNG